MKKATTEKDIKKIIDARIRQQNFRYLKIFVPLILYIALIFLLGSSESEWGPITLVILLIVIGCPVGGIYISDIEDQKTLLRYKPSVKSEELHIDKEKLKFFDDEELSKMGFFQAKVFGWSSAALIFGLAYIVGWSGVLDYGKEVARERSIRLENQKRAAEKRIYLRRLEDAAGKHYDKNCSKSTYGC